MHAKERGLNMAGDRADDMIREEDKGACTDLKKLIVEVRHHGERLNKVEAITDRQEKDLTQLKTNHAETRVYVKQILDSIDKLENKIFSYVSQLAAAQEKDDQEERKERTQTAEQWIDLLKYVLGGTIIAIVAYLFGSGQVPG
jgi:hemerythrin-like domain-containing protein